MPGTVLDSGSLVVEKESGLMKLVLSGTQKISMKTIDKIIWGFNKSYEDDKLDNLIQRN